ncbi:MAG: hypothetical protein GX764_01280 [Firmicutes bacterium]|nr:hypothetical protein [Bacillota bacterium]
MLVEVNSHWNCPDLEKIFLTGGGGQAVSSYLLPQLPQASLVADPTTANCRGFLSWGNRIWQVSSASEDAI